MPHLLIRGVSEDRLRTVAAPLAEELAAVCSCGTDNFTISCLHSTNVFGSGPDDPEYAFIEVGWFERGQQVRDRFAATITKFIGQLGVPEIEVVFAAYREDSYYINGKPVNAS